MDIAHMDRGSIDQRVTSRQGSQQGDEDAYEAERDKLLTLEDRV